MVEQKLKRNTFNIILLIIYLLLSVIFPLLALMPVAFDEKISNSKFLTGVWRFTFLFMSLPVYGIYAVKIVKAYFPVRNSKAFWVVLPAVVTILIYILKKDSNLLEMLILSAFPMFLGFFALLTLRAVGIIIFKRSKNKNYNPDEARFTVKLNALILTLVLLALLLFPAGCFSIIGLEMNANNLQDYEAIAKFVFSIVLYMFFHYKIFTQVLDEGYVQNKKQVN